MELLQQICSECGIALVYTPCISKAPIYGATRWIRNSSKPLIQITDRQKKSKPMTLLLVCYCQKKKEMSCFAIQITQSN
jgi:hypothetical protein